MERNVKYLYAIILSLLLISCKLGLIGIDEDNQYHNQYVKDSTKSYVSYSLEKDTVIYAEKLLPLADKLEMTRSVEVGSAYYGSGVGGSGIGYGYGLGSYHAPSQSVKIITVLNTKVLKQNSDLAEGRIIYKIPDVMKVRNTYKVLVRISKSKAIVSMIDSLSGTIKTSEIPVTESMLVRLVDLSPKDRKVFDIVEVNNAIQGIDSCDVYTEWSWSVTPIRVAKSKLEIVVSVIRNNKTKDIVYEDTVNVEIDVIKQTLFFVGTYWMALLTSFIVPFSIWYYKNRKKKKKK